MCQNVDASMREHANLLRMSAEVTKKMRWEQNQRIIYY